MTHANIINGSRVEARIGDYEGPVGLVVRDEEVSIAYIAKRKPDLGTEATVDGRRYRVLAARDSRNRNPRGMIVVALEPQGGSVA